MARTKKDFDIAIIGGGIAGITLAIALHSRGIKIKLYERAAKFGEIGAGVSFTPNAVAAMKECHEGVYEAFNKVCTRNTWPSKRNVFFDYVAGYEEGKDAQEKIQFTTTNAQGQNAVHRAHFLDEMVKLVPREISEFGKGLVDITDAVDGSGRKVMHFADGTTASADAVIACDGIKSRARVIMFGADHPCAYPTYTHKYAYRGLVPMDAAIAAVGEEMAQNSFMHLGPDGHMLTFPVNHGKTLNIVAFRYGEEEWEDHERLTKLGKRSDALKDFAGWSTNVLKLLSMCDEELNIWAIFDLAKHPVPTFVKGRVALMGDAAHATSPHHGAGAGFCIEDAAVMATILASDAIQTPAHLEAAFAAYNDARLERGHWLVQSSRRVGDLYDWRAEGPGSDMKKIQEELEQRNRVIFEADVPRMCALAAEDARKRVQGVLKSAL